MFGCRRDSKVTGSIGHQPVPSATPASWAIPARPLRRDDVGDVGLVGGEIGYERAGLRIDRYDFPAIRQRHPLDELGIELLPGVLEQALLREIVLRIEDDQLRARFRLLQIIGDQARPLIRSRRAAERIGRGRDHDRPAIGHRFELTAQQKGLVASQPGVRHHRGRGLVITGQRVPADRDPRRQAPAGRNRAPSRRGA